jgi:hypothetical protein
VANGKKNGIKTYGKPAVIRRGELGSAQNPTLDAKGNLIRSKLPPIPPAKPRKSFKEGMRPLGH